MPLNSLLQHWHPDRSEAKCVSTASERRSFGCAQDDKPYFANELCRIPEYKLRLGGIVGLDTVEIILRTEETFSIDLPDDECGQVRTVGDLYRLVLEKLKLSYESAAEIERMQEKPFIGQSLLQLRTSPLTAPEVWYILKQIITDQLQVQEDEVCEQARFVEDLWSD